MLSTVRMLRRLLRNALLETKRVNVMRTPTDFWLKSSERMWLSQAPSSLAVRIKQAWRMDNRLGGTFANFSLRYKMT